MAKMLTNTDGGALVDINLVNAGALVDIDLIDPVDCFSAIEYRMSLSK